MSSEREKLAEHLYNLGFSESEDMADWVINDRKRILSGVTKELELLKSFFEDRREVLLHINDIDWKPIDEIIKLANLPKDTK